MKRSRTRWLRLPDLLAAMLLAASTPGCVSYESYDALADERDQLREEKERMEQANQSADQARVKALEQGEDLREERDKLAQEVKKLTRRVSELESALKDREHAQQVVTARTAANDARWAPLRTELDVEVQAGQIQITERPGGLQLVVAEELLFAPASADLTARGKNLLGRLALRVRDEDQRVEVEGAADTPALRLTRGASVMRALSQGGVPNEQMRAASFIDEDPDVAADGPARRGVEIRLLPNLGAGPGATGLSTPAPRLAAPAASPRP